MRAQTEALDPEYRWDPSSAYARATFPDRYLPEFRNIDVNVLQVEGGVDRWDTEVRVTQPATVVTILETIRTQVLSNSRNVHSIHETTPELAFHRDPRQVYDPKLSEYVLD